MKRKFLLLCFAVMFSFCFSTCDKTEKKVILQVEVDDKHLQKFEDYLNAFINNDDIAFEKLKNGDMNEIEDFIDDNILSLEKASKIEALLIQYGYKI